MNVFPYQLWEEPDRKLGLIMSTQLVNRWMPTDYHRCDHPHAVQSSYALSQTKSMAGICSMETLAEERLWSLGVDLAEMTNALRFPIHDEELRMGLKKQLYVMLHRLKPTMMHGYYSLGLCRMIDGILCILLLWMQSLKSTRLNMGILKWAFTIL